MPTGLKVYWESVRTETARTAFPQPAAGAGGQLYPHETRDSGEEAHRSVVCSLVASADFKGVA